MGYDAVRWQGAPTQWADAHQEKQHSQRTVAWLNRLRSVLTRWVKAGGERNLTIGMKPSLRWEAVNCRI